MTIKKTESNVILTIVGSREYRKRLIDITKRVSTMGWGARAKVARGTDLAPSTISNVLNGRLLSSMHLDRIEQYLNTDQGGKR